MFELLLSAGLITHVATYWLLHGKSYWTTNFAPAFGILVPDCMFRTVHILGVPLVATSLLVETGSALGPAVAAVALIAWASIQSMRLSNHIWLAVISVSLYALSSLNSLSAQILLGGMYATAGLVKLNGEFLRSPHSVARIILQDVAISSTLLERTQLMRIAPLSVAVSEILVGTLLIWGNWLLLALAIATCLHATFSLVGNTHFALVALSLWSVALGPASAERLKEIDEFGPVTGVGIVAGISVALWSQTELRGSRLIGRTVDGTFLAIFTVGAGAIVSTYVSEDRQEWSPVATGLLVFFCVNLIGLVTGLKSEWAFAMFSNVRPFGRAGVLGVSPLWRHQYFTVRLVNEDAPFVTDLPVQVRRALAGDDYMVSAPVVAALTNVAERYGESIRVVRQKFDDRETTMRDAEEVVSGKFFNSTCRPILVPPVLGRDRNTVYMG